jgi:hypothetical protein
MLVYISISSQPISAGVHHMTLSSNGITSEVIREMMPPYNLSNDLLEATFAALPAPPHDASTTWRYARITRLIAEIAAFMPADAVQARLATQILIMREMADTLTNRAYRPGVTIEQMCRLSRSSAEMVRTGALLERTLVRHQQKPVAFFGTVVADQVDVAALDAVWCGNPTPQPAAPEAGTPKAGTPKAGTPKAGTPKAGTGGTSARLLVLGADPVGSRSGGEAAPAGHVGPALEVDQPGARLVADARATSTVVSLPAHSDPNRANARALRERVIDVAAGIPADAGSCVLDAGLGAVPRLGA